MLLLLVMSSPPGGSWEEGKPPLLCSFDVKIMFPRFSAHDLLGLPGQQLQRDEQPRREGDIPLSCMGCLSSAVVRTVSTRK